MGNSGTGLHMPLIGHYWHFPLAFPHLLHLLNMACGLRHEMSSLARHWDHGLETHSRHGCLSACLCCPMFGYRPCDGLIPVQGDLPNI
jgi:hypothetical protein